MIRASRVCRITRPSRAMAEDRSPPSAAQASSESRRLPPSTIRGPRPLSLLVRTSSRHALGSSAARSFLELLERLVVRFFEVVEDLLLLGLLPVSGLQDEPDQQFSRLDHWLVTVLQHLDPLHRATGEAPGRFVAELSFKVLDSRLVHVASICYIRN